MGHSRSVVSSAKLVALCTLLSRITGLVREMLFAQTFGLRWVQDAFLFAFAIPNLFRRLLGEGAMAAVFVPTFTSLLERAGREAAWRLLARTLALLCVALLALVIVIELVLLALWHFAPTDAEKLAAWKLLLSLTAIMLPFMVGICVLALLSAILNCVGSFVPAALAPVLLNLALIVGVLWLGPWLRPGSPEGQIHLMAWTVVAAGALQILFVLPALRANGVRLGWRWEPGDPAVRRMLGNLVPVALGQGVLALGVYLDAQICVLLTRKPGAPPTMDLLGGAVAYPLGEGALTAITYAQRLYQFPLGVLVLSLATAAMPAFSRLAAREEWPAWTAEVRRTLRLAVFEGLLAGTFMVLLALPIVRLLFEYRNFTAADTARTGYVLVYYGLALWAYCAQHMVSRAFYSLHDVRTPLKISAAVLPLNVALTLVFVWFDALREAAFALSSLITSALAVVIALVLLQRRACVPLLDRDTAGALGKMLIAAGACAVTLLALRPLTPQIAELLPGRVAPRALEALGPLVLGTAAFLAAAWLLKLPEVKLLLGVIRERGARRAEAQSPP